jgi:hypothetical protein
MHVREVGVRSFDRIELFQRVSRFGERSELSAHDFVGGRYTGQFERDEYGLDG